MNTIIYLQILQMAVECLCSLCYQPSTRDQYAPEVVVLGFNKVYESVLGFLNVKGAFEKYKKYMLRYSLQMAMGLH